MPSIYGPYISKKEKRRRIIIITDTGKRTSMLYARWLYQQHYSIILEPNEQVHHKNEDTLDDRIENYEIRLLGEHQAEHNRNRKKNERKINDRTRT